MAKNKYTFGINFVLWPGPYGQMKFEQTLTKILAPIGSEGIQK
jgi:uncharacterized membrane protein